MKYTIYYRPRPPSCDPHIGRLYQIVGYLEDPGELNDYFDHPDTQGNYGEYVVFHKAEAESVATVWVTEECIQAQQCAGWLCEPLKELIRGIYE